MQRIDLDTRLVGLDRPRVMGILNVTPDSFSDGGEVFEVESALERAGEMVTAGADIIDVGGESTRPGAAPVSLDEELRRVVPVIRALTREFSIPVSVDTSKPEVMSAAVTAGAGMINDVLALRAPGAVEAAVGLGIPVCLMHMQGEPRTMQTAPRYDDVVADVIDFLRERMVRCVAAGISPERIILDPGFGFGKTLEHNLALLAGLGRIAALGPPLLVGLSRKSMLGALTGRDVDERLAASLSAALIAAERGAMIFRVHDVAATVDGLRLWHAVHLAFESP